MLACLFWETLAHACFGKRLRAPHSREAVLRMPQGLSELVGAALAEAWGRAGRKMMCVMQRQLPANAVRGRFHALGRLHPAAGRRSANTKYALVGRI